MQNLFSRLCNNLLCDYIQLFRVIRKMVMVSKHKMMETLDFILRIIQISTLNASFTTSALCTQAGAHPKEGYRATAPHPLFQPNRNLKKRRIH